MISRKSLYSRKGGFTLIEVLVAVIILGLVATASFRLMIMSGRTINEVQVQRELLNRAREIQFSMLFQEKADSGRENDMAWETRKISQPVFGGKWEVAYRRVDLTYKGRTIVIYLP